LADMRQLKYDDKSKILTLCYGKKLKRSVIGVYFRNGVFGETNDNYGISYLTDQLLFEHLCDYNFGCYTDIKLHTFYGYTFILIKCNNSDLNRVFGLLDDALDSFDPGKYDLELIKNHQNKRIQSSVVNITDKLLCDFYANDRFLLPIAGTLHGISGLTASDLRKWFLHRTGIDRNICISMPCGMAPVINDRSAAVKDDKKPQIFGCKNLSAVTDVCSNGETELAFAVALTGDNAVVAELLSVILRGRIKEAVAA